MTPANANPEQPHEELKRSAIAEAYTTGATAPRPQRRKRKTKRGLPAGYQPLGLTLTIESYLSGMDPVTQSWAPLISTSIAFIMKRQRITLDEALDWIYETEAPVSLFDFRDWTRNRPHGSNNK